MDVIQECIDDSPERPSQIAKTSVSLLHEILLSMKLGFPMFQLKRIIGGQTSEQTFEMSVVVESLGLTALGIARSKMLAKHKAADRLLEQIQQAGDNGMALNTISKEILLECCGRIKSARRQNVDSSLELNMSSNQLKQYCMSQELTLVYEVTEIIGPPNNRKFVMSCKVKNYATQGEGKSKKEAKTYAAEKMLLLLEA